MCVIDLAVALQADTGGTVTQLTGPGGTDPVIAGTTVDTNGATGGTYTFQYEVGAGTSCADIATMTIIVTEMPTTPADADYCDDDNTNYNILDIVNGGDGTGATSPAGTWTTTVAGSAAATFNPQTLGAGTYQIQACLTADASGNNIGETFETATPANLVTPTGVTSCDCCVTWNITVLAAPNAGIDATVAVCN